MRKALIGLILALVAAPALAEALIYRDAVVTVRVADRPCENQLLAEHLKVFSATPPLAARVHFKGRDMAACAVPNEQRGIMAVLDEEGSGGLLPLAAFKDDPGV